MSNPYEILGIQPGSSETDIKKAYRDLAKKFHPDKGGSEPEFKKINEAYTQIMKGEDPMNTFPELNEIFNLFTNFGMGMGMNQFTIRGPTIKTTLEITLEELQSGGNFPVSYKRLVPSGKYVNTVSNTPFGVLNVVTPEEIEKEYTVHIDIPKCYDNRKPLIFSKLAKADNLPPGDLEVTIILQKHSVYTKINGTFDLQIELEITLKESLTGFIREIKLLGSDETVKVECSSIVNPYDIKRIKGYGMQSINNLYGDLLIKFKIIFPILLSPEAVDIIKNLDF